MTHSLCTVPSTPIASFKLDRYLAAVVGTLTVLPEDRHAKYGKLGVSGGAKRIFLEFLFSVFPGSVPGGLWQVWDWDYF